MQPDGTPDKGANSADPLLPPEIVANLPAPLQDALHDPRSRAEILSFTAAFAGWAGPYPPPDLLRGYEHVLPGAADRIIRMAERQQEHRHHLEKTTVEGASRRSWWGLWLGFVISVVLLALGTVIILTGHQWAGAAIMGVDVVALAGVFVYGQRQQSKERTEKDAQSHQQPSAPSGHGRPQVSGKDADQR